MRASELKHPIVFLEKTVVEGKYLEKKETLTVKFRLKCKVLDLTASDVVQNSEEFNEQVITVETYRRPITAKMIAEFNGEKYNVITTDPLSYNQNNMRVRIKKIQQ